jgi:S-adenosylmethionine decarboxylase
MMKHLGHQTTVDLYGCKPSKINSCDFITTVLLEAANILNFTVVNTTIHSFSPIGISGVIVIEESHIAIHTWPEYNYVAIDFFTCNTDKILNLEAGVAWLKDQFESEYFNVKEVQRGNLEDIQRYKRI